MRTDAVVIIVILVFVVGALVGQTMDFGLRDCRATNEVLIVSLFQTDREASQYKTLSEMYYEELNVCQAGAGVKAGGAGGSPGAPVDLYDPRDPLYVAP